VGLTASILGLDGVILLFLFGVPVGAILVLMMLDSRRVNAWRAGQPKPGTQPSVGVVPSDSPHLRLGPRTGKVVSFIILAPLVTGVVLGITWLGAAGRPTQGETSACQTWQWVNQDLAGTRPKSALEPLAVFVIENRGLPGPLGKEARALGRTGQTKAAVATEFDKISATCSSYGIPP